VMMELHDLSELLIRDSSVFLSGAEACRLKKSSFRSPCWTTAPKRTVLDAPCFDGVRVPDRASRKACNGLRENRLAVCID
jgi:hypothetical protein